MVKVISILLSKVRVALISSRDLGPWWYIFITHKRVILFLLLFLLCLVIVLGWLGMLSLLRIIISRHKFILMLLLSTLPIKVMVLLRPCSNIIRFGLDNISFWRCILLWSSIPDNNRFFYHIDIIIILDWGHVEVIILLEIMLVIVLLLRILLLVIKHIIIGL